MHFIPEVISRRCVKVALFIVLNILIVVLLIRSRHHAELSQRNPRIDTILGTLSKETLDQSIHQLYGSDLQYLYPGYDTESHGDQTDLEVMLSNRRSVKVLQEIEKLPPNHRPLKCRELFDQALEAHTNAWNMILKSEDDPSASTNQQSLYATKEALCVAMFITADIGEADLLSTEFRRLDEVRREFEPRVTANKLSHPHDGAWLLNECIVPDNRFQVNALRLAATRVGENGDLLKRCDEECARVKMKKKEMPIVPWFSRVALFDCLPEGPLDTNHVVFNLTSYDWKSPMDIFVNKAGEDEVINHLRAILFH